MTKNRTLTIGTLRTVRKTVLIQLERKVPVLHLRPFEAGHDVMLGATKIGTLYAHDDNTTIVETRNPTPSADPSVDTCTITGPSNKQRIIEGVNRLLSMLEKQTMSRSLTND